MWRTITGVLIVGALFLVFAVVGLFAYAATSIRTHARMRGQS